MSRLRHLVVCLVIAAGGAKAGAGPTVPVDPLADYKDKRDRSKDAPLNDFRLISYFFVRGTVTNQVADPLGLRGVSLGPIGQLVGSATSVGRDPAYFLESRWIPVIEYSPFFVDNYAVLRAQFEIDFMWGRGSNVAQQNEGGGFNADQVNLQTKNINVALYPTRDPAQLGIFLGTQSVYDSVFDPTRTPVGDLVKTGYKLMYLASDATGLSAYFGFKGLGKVQFLPLQAAQPDRITRNDPRLKLSFLTTADYSYEVTPGTLVGASVWHLRDDTKGAGYAFEGLVASGPGSVGLGPFTGVPRLNIEMPFGGVTWLGTNFQHNLHFNTGPLALSGFAMLNMGRYVNGRPDSTQQPVVDILGLGLNLEGVYNWGRTINDVVSLEFLYTTPDLDPSDNRYTGVFTMNQYGLPGAVWFNHKMLLLFPMTSTVNNYTGAVTDISNQGHGVTAGIASGAWDIVPHKLNLKLATGFAMANTSPAGETAGVAPGRFMGLEVNAELRWHIRYLMTVGLHGGYMFKGDFYAGNPRVTASPWAAFTTFTWYGF